MHRNEDRNENKKKYYAEAFERTALCVGPEALEILAGKRVLVCGIGGVGSHAAAALARSGVGALRLCDDDRIVNSNINRQLQANAASVGRYKTEALRDMITEINPYCSVETRTEYIEDANIPALAEGCDFVIDAIDTVSSKLGLIKYCKNSSIEIASSMGTGNKLRPELLELADIYETSVCPLAKVVRSELRKMGISGLIVCYSKETPIKTADESPDRKRSIGSVSFVPPVSGYILAGYAVRKLIGALS